MHCFMSGLPLQIVRWFAVISKWSLVYRFHEFFMLAKCFVYLLLVIFSGATTFAGMFGFYHCLPVIKYYIYQRNELSVRAGSQV
jgi:hypothetical protein